MSSPQVAMLQAFVVAAELAQDVIAVIDELGNAIGRVPVDTAFDDGSQ